MKRATKTHIIVIIVDDGTISEFNIVKVESSGSESRFSAPGFFCTGPVDSGPFHCSVFMFFILNIFYFIKLQAFAIM